MLRFIVDGSRWLLEWLQSFGHNGSWNFDEGVVPLEWSISGANKRLLFHEEYCPYREAWTKQMLVDHFRQRIEQFLMLNEPGIIVAVNVQLHVATSLYENKDLTEEQLRQFKWDRRGSLIIPYELDGFPIELRICHPDMNVPDVSFSTRSVMMV